LAEEFLVGLFYSSSSASKEKAKPTGHNAADVITELMTSGAKNRTKKLNGAHQK